MKKQGPARWATSEHPRTAGPRGFRSLRAWLAAPIAVACLAACAYAPKVPYTTQRDPMAELPTENGGVEDGRGRFREILCTVLEDHGRELEWYMPCQDALTKVGQEPSPTGRPVYLGMTSGKYLVGLVPGLGWECIEGWLNRDDWGPIYMNRFGYDTRLIDVDGLSGTATNAGQINDFVLSLPAEYSDRRLILMGYSKGAPDLLEFVVNYPETARRVAAVVSVAGAVGGSALATEYSQGQAEMLTWMPGSECGKGDGGAMASLHPETRRQWLADHPLPDHIRYFSVVSWPDPETRISRGLKSTYRQLAELQDARNDGQVVFYDQFIPGSTLVGFLNADHWAMGVPVASHHEIVARTLVNHNRFPREAFLEAVIRFVEEDLAETCTPAADDRAGKEAISCGRD